jgi:hypothetical protein
MPTRDKRVDFLACCLVKGKACRIELAASNHLVTVSGDPARTAERLRTTVEDSSGTGAA